jgi:hypothetical protein
MSCARARDGRRAPTNLDYQHTPALSILARRPRAAQVAKIVEILAMPVPVAAAADALTERSSHASGPMLSTRSRPAVLGVASISPRRLATAQAAQRGGEIRRPHTKWQMHQARVTVNSGGLA